MTGLSLLLVIYMVISLFYVEIIFKSISNESQKREIKTEKPIVEIIGEILDAEGLSDTVQIDRSSERDTSESFYAEKAKAIQISEEDGTVQSVAAAIHECGHAIQYNKSETALKVIRIRDVLKIFSLLDVASPMAVPFFSVFCPPLYILFSIFLFKLIARVIVEFIVEADANRRIFKYLKKYISDPDDRRAARKFLTACSITYLSTAS